MTIECDFCAAIIDPAAPTTYSDEHGGHQWCQDCEDAMRAKVDAMTPGELADWLERDGKRDTRQFDRVLEALRYPALASAQAEPGEGR